MRECEAANATCDVVMAHVTRYRSVSCMSCSGRSEPRAPSHRCGECLLESSDRRGVHPREPPRVLRHSRGFARNRFSCGGRVTRYWRPAWWRRVGGQMPPTPHWSPGDPLGVLRLPFLPLLASRCLCCPCDTAVTAVGLLIGPLPLCVSRLVRCVPRTRASADVPSQ